MAHIAESVPLTDIYKIETYINSRGLPLREVLAETGASWALNSIMYNADGSPCSHLKVDGKVLGKPDYNVWGLAWDKGPDIHAAKLPNLPGGEADLPERNYIGGVNLVRQGEAVEKPIYAKAQGGTRGRTAWGLKPGRFAAYCSKDGSADARTPEQLRDLLEDYGWEFAAMGDCGGSSQAVLNGREIREDRVVRYLLLIYLKQDQLPQLDGGSHYTPTIRAYSLQRDGETKVAPNFRVREFRCRDGSDPIFIADMLPQVLQAVRDHFGTEVTITSGFRTAQYNLGPKVGGAMFSQHQYGCAADIVVEGHGPEEVGRVARRIMPSFGGVGIYMKKGFTHIDVRAKRADWRE